MGKQAGAALSPDETPRRRVSDQAIPYTLEWTLAASESHSRAPGSLAGVARSVILGSRASRHASRRRVSGR